MACLEVDATGIQSTAVEQIPVREVEGEDTHGVVELAERVAVVVIAVVLEGCVRFSIPDEMHRGFQFVGHVLYHLFRSFHETVLEIPSKLFWCSVRYCCLHSKRREVQTADLSRIVDHCVRMNVVCQVALWKDTDVTGRSDHVLQGTGRGKEVIMVFCRLKGEATGIEVVLKTMGGGGETSPLLVG